jgi:large subunit ribosomal protein L9
MRTLIETRSLTAPFPKFWDLEVLARLGYSWTQGGRILLGREFIYEKNMEVILKKEISGVGRAGDLKTVREGYARNYLLPQKLAVLATEGVKREFAVRRVKATKREEEQLKVLEEKLSALKSLEITISAKASEDGTLFAGVHATDVLNALEGIGVSGLKVTQISAPTVKILGDHHFTIHLTPEKHTQGVLHVTAE